MVNRHKSSINDGIKKFYNPRHEIIKKIINDIKEEVSDVVIKKETNKGNSLAYSLFKSSVVIAIISAIVALGGQIDNTLINKVSNNIIVPEKALDNTITNVGNTIPKNSLNILSDISHVNNTVLNDTLNFMQIQNNSIILDNKIVATLLPNNLSDKSYVDSDLITSQEASKILNPNYLDIKINTLGDFYDCPTDLDGLWSYSPYATITIPSYKNPDTNETISENTVPLEKFLKNQDTYLEHINGDYNHKLAISSQFRINNINFDPNIIYVKDIRSNKNIISEENNPVVIIPGHISSSNGKPVPEKYVKYKEFLDKNKYVNDFSGDKTNPDDFVIRIGKDTPISKDLKEIMSKYVLTNKNEPVIYDIPQILDTYQDVIHNTGTSNAYTPQYFERQQYKHHDYIRDTNQSKRYL